MTHTRPSIPDVPFHPGPTYKPPPKPIRSNTDINLDFEENSPFQEGIISETYQRLDKSFFHEPKELNNLVNTCNLIQKFLPQQADIDKVPKEIQMKVLRGTYLLVEIKEIQAGYLDSSHFKDIYLYRIIILYYSCLFVGHQGVINTYLTISNKFFIPNLIHYLRSYIKGCHICQLACKEKPPVR